MTERVWRAFGQETSGQVTVLNSDVSVGPCLRAVSRCSTRIGTGMGGIVAIQ